jgi:hypothetical protein
VVNPKFGDARSLLQINVTIKMNQIVSYSLTRLLHTRLLSILGYNNPHRFQLQHRFLYKLIGYYEISLLTNAFGPTDLLVINGLNRTFKLSTILIIITTGLLGKCQTEI